MPVAKKAPAKKAATPAEDYAEVIDLDLEPEPFTVTLTEAAKDLALDFLFKRAYKYGQLAHARTNIEMQKIPDEVKAVLYAVADRNVT